MSVVVTLNHNSVVLSIGTFDKSKSEKCLILLSGLFVPASGRKRGWSTETAEKSAFCAQPDY
jgi:hypothetical protein